MKKILLFINVALLFGCFSKEPAKTGKEGKPMPDFNMLLMDSITSINSAKIPSDKPIVLFYFSPHCSYCKSQVKEIIEDMDQLKDIRFYFVSAYSLKEVKTFYNDYQLAKYPNITTGLDTAHSIAEYFEITGVPFLAIYGKNKLLNKSYYGKIYNSQIKKAIEN
jgi:peroxiredoxin